METYNRAYSSRPTGRNAQPETSRDIVSSPILSSMSFMGNFSDKEIEASIRKTLEEHKEIVFKPRNFGV